MIHVQIENDSSAALGSILKLGAKRYLLHNLISGTNAVYRAFQIRTANPSCEAFDKGSAWHINIYLPLSLVVAVVTTIVVSPN